MTQATTIEQLQDQATKLGERVGAKQAEQATLLSASHALVLKMVDSTAGERPALLRQRTSLATERDAVADELAELKQRRDTADLAVFLFAEGQAQQAAETATAAETAARIANTAVLDEQRRRHSSTRTPATAESDAALLALEVRVVRVAAAARIAERDARGAAQVLQAARYATAGELARQAAQDGLQA